MAVPFNKFNDFSEQLHRGKHDFGSHTFKVMLTNTAPAVTNAVKGDIAEIDPGSGYSAGGVTVTVTLSESSGTTTVFATQAAWAASGGAIGPYRYAVLYNDTTSSPAKPLVGWLDYGSANTTNDGDTFTIRFSGTSPGEIFHHS